jgi:hypothetical protein
VGEKMNSIVKIIEVASNLGGGYAIFTVVALLYSKYDAIKTKSKYTIEDFAFDFWGGSREDSYFNLFTDIYIIALVATVLLIFFLDETTDIIFILIKIIALIVSLIASFKR